MPRFPRPLRPAGFLAGALCALALAGCTLVSLARMEPPHVDVTGVRLLSTTLAGAQVMVQFQVDNPNDRELVLDGVGYKVRLNGQRLLEGRYDQRTEIAASGRTAVELPVTIRLDDLYRAIRSLRGNNDPDYSLDADLLFAVPVLGEVTVPVTKTGKLPVDRLLQQLGQ
jgi:LEA14-like dessication related protein